MKKHLLYVVLLVSFTFPFKNSSAQEVHPVSGEPLKYCGSTEATQELLNKQPHLKAAYELFEEEQKKQRSKTASSKGSQQTNQLPIHTIPVVFHILHSFGPENIPDLNVHDAIRVLNEDFRRRNADTSDVVAAFKSLAGDAEIEFALAKIDPNGNCTNGIDRIISSKTYKGDDAAKLNIWPRNKYLNIWVVNDIPGNAAGYTYLPFFLNSNPSIDGIVILYNYLGTLGPSSTYTSRTLTHEVGHWINLPHVWGATNAPGVQCGDDNVTDTPVTKGWNSCNLTSNAVCTSGVQENVQNYMEYSYCSRMYTLEQCAIMRASLESTIAERSTLWSTANLAATGVSTAATLCKADFTASKKIICAGSTVSFKDLSWSVTPTSWQWDFDNNGTTDSTTQNSSYTFTTPGTYSVTLTVSDGVTTQTTTKPSLIVVLAADPIAYVPYSESFESATFPSSTDYYITSQGVNSFHWNRVTTAAYTGSASLKLDNQAQSSDIDEFITPAIDLSSITGPTMTFRVAYKRRNSGDTLDQLRVLSSTNCGISWVPRYTKGYSTLPTVTSTSSTAFVPTIAQWRLEPITISSFAGQSQVRFKFEFTGNGAGNNVYIDDININGTLSIEEEVHNGFGLTVYPNPFGENTTVSFNIQDKYNVAIGLYDVLGKEIISISNSTELAPGSYSLPLNKSNLKPGIYFIKLEVDGYTAMKKVIVQ